MSTRKRDEPVRLTRIYTRGGDRGETSLGDGSRVPKLDCRIAAFGTVDELNSQLGFVLAGDVPSRFRPWLERIQNDLFDVGADLSVPFGVTDRLRVTEESVQMLERLCDELNADLPELRSFVIPGGTETAARLHVARAVCRRAERDARAAGRPYGGRGRTRRRTGQRRRSSPRHRCCRRRRDRTRCPRPPPTRCASAARPSRAAGASAPPTPRGRPAPASPRPCRRRAGR